MRLDGLERFGRLHSGGPPTSVPEQGPSSIPLQVDPSPGPFPSPSIQDGQQAHNKDRIPIQVPSVAPGAYTNNGWTATNITPEPDAADVRRPAADLRRPGLPIHHNRGPAPYSPDNPDPEVAGLQPHFTMWVQFKDVLSYRAYRLHNTRANVRNSENKRIGKNVPRIKNLISPLGNFNGSEPIALLKFLRGRQEVFNILQAPEGTAIRTMAFLLRGDARTSTNHGVSLPHK